MRRTPASAGSAIPHRRRPRSEPARSFRKPIKPSYGWRALAGLPIEKVNAILRLAKAVRGAQYNAERKENCQAV